MDTQKPEFSVPAKVEAPQQEVPAIAIDRIKQVDVSTIPLSALDVVFRDGDIHKAVDTLRNDVLTYAEEIDSDKTLSQNEVFDSIVEFQERNDSAIQQLLEIGGFASDQVIEQGGTATEKPIKSIGHTNVGEYEASQYETDVIEPVDKTFAEIVANSFDLDEDELNLIKKFSADAETATNLETQPESFGGFIEVAVTDEDKKPKSGSKNAEQHVYDTAFDEIVESLQTEPEFTSIQTIYTLNQIDTPTSKRDGLAYEALDTDPAAQEIVANNSTDTTNEDSIEDAVEKMMSEKAIERKVTASTSDAKEAFIIVEAIADCKQFLSNADIYVDKALVIKKKLEKSLKESNTDLSDTNELAKDVLKKFFDAMERKDEDFDDIEGTPYDEMEDLVDVIMHIDKQLKREDEERSWRVVRGIVETANVSDNSTADTSKDAKSSTTPTVFMPTTRPELDQIDEVTTEVVNVLNTLSADEVIHGNSVSFKDMANIAQREKLDIVTTAKKLIADKEIVLNEKDQKLSTKDAIVVYIVAKNSAKGKSFTKTQIREMGGIAEAEVTQYHEMKQLIDGDDASSYQPQDDSSSDDTSVDNTQFAVTA